MGLNKKQLENIMGIIEQAGGSKAKLPSLTLGKTVNPLEGLQAQSKNAITRLQNIGVDTEPLTETRNPLEQALNLPEEQNMFFDLLEVINRPQQALFGGIVALQKGQDFGKGFMEGLTGEEGTYGGDIVRNAIGQREDGTIDWTDFAGYALDILLDPADLALGLVTGGASVGVQAGAQVADTVGDVAKVANTLDAGADAVKLAKEGVEGAQALNTVRKSNLLGLAQDVVLGKGNRIHLPESPEEYLKLLTDKKYRAEKGIQKISITDSVFRTAGSGIKVGGMFADSLIETALGKVDNGLVDTYKAFKNQFSETMKNTAGAVRKAVSASEQKLVSTYEKFTDMFKEYDSVTKELAGKSGMSVPEFQRALMSVFEHDNLPAQNLNKFEMLDYVVNSPNGLIRSGEETEKALVEMFGKDMIENNTRKITQTVGEEEMEFIYFEKDFWNMDNADIADMYYESQSSGLSMLRKSEVEDYEIALKNKSPEKFAEYEQLKKSELEDDLLEKEVEVEFENRYPRESLRRPTDAKEVAKRKGAIRTQLRKKRLKNKAGAEYFLKANVGAEDIKKFTTGSFDEASELAKLNVTDQYNYKLAKKADEKLIDNLIEGRYPRSSGLSGEALADYNKRRATYAMQLRADMSNFPNSQKVLSEALANPSVDELLMVDTVDDFDNLDVDVKLLPKELQGDFKELFKQRKELADIRAKVSTDTLLEKSVKYKNKTAKYEELKKALYIKYNRLAEPVLKPKVAEQVAETVVKETKVPIQRFYTQEQLEAIQEMKKNSFVMEGVDKFKNTINEVQKQIGITEFGKANALTDLSMEGYATHVQTEEAKEIWDKVTAYANKNDVKGFFAPGNTRVLSSRGYRMSSIEANNVKKAYNKMLWENDAWFQANVPEDMKGLVEEFFEVDGFSEMADDSIMGLMDDKYKAINKNKRTTDMLVAMSIGDPNGNTSAVRFINASAPEPKGFVRLRTDETRKLRKVIAETKKYAGEGLYINKLLSTIESGLGESSQLVMEKHLYNMLNIFEKDPSDALQVLDKFNSIYKMFKTSNVVGFNGKNFTGNTFNMWASGMSFPDVIRNWNKASDYIKKFESAKLVDEALRTPEQKQVVDAMTDMLQNGYFDINSVYKLNDMGEFKAIKSMKDIGKRNNLLDNPLTRANMGMNLWVDNHARMSLYLYAKENPQYLSRLGFDATDPKSAMNAVRMVLFDPKDLSLWEEDYMKRLIPFYTFTRQNLAFQMKNITRNSDKYYKAYKTMNSLYNAQGLDVDEVNQWERDDFYLPIIGKKDGKYISLKTSLPFADLINLFQDPVRKFASSTNPLIKGTYEGLTGTNVFTGNPIENYEGEMSKNIPFVTKKTEWEMSQAGLDVPVRTATGTLGLIGDLASGQDVTANLGRATGLSYEGDVEKAKQAREYQKINALLDKIKAVKASGTEVPTLAEIAKQKNSAKTSSKLAQMQDIMDMINNIKR